MQPEEVRKVLEDWFKGSGAGDATGTSTASTQISDQTEGGEEESNAGGGSVSSGGPAQARAEEE
jgi:hypothetical protein